MIARSLDCVERGGRVFVALDDLIEFFFSDGRTDVANALFELESTGRYTERVSQ